MSTDDAGAVEEAIASQPGDQQANTDTGEPSNDGWLFADEVNGDGDKPEWFKSDKYKTVSEQAKAYVDLESKFGSFKGAPESYEIGLSEELKEQGVEFQEGDIMLEQAMEFAKNSNMSQEGFNDMVNLYATTKVAEQKADEDYKSEEIKSLGSNGIKRLENLSSWGKSNLSAELYEGFEGMIQTSASVQAMEKLIAMTRSSPVSPDSASMATSASSEEVRKMQFEKDEFGNRRIQTDPDFKARYNKMRDEVWGVEDNRIIIGG